MTSYQQYKKLCAFHFNAFNLDVKYGLSDALPVNFLKTSETQASPLFVFVVVLRVRDPTVSGVRAFWNTKNTKNHEGHEGIFFVSLLCFLHFFTLHFTADIEEFTLNLRSTSKYVSPGKDINQR
jgi:hypothetical protein